MKLDTRHAAFVQFPLHGEWLALDTPARRIPRHDGNAFGQRYAYDFVRAQGRTRRVCTAPLWQRVFGQVPASEFLAWDQPVFAAFDGRVVQVGDGWPDRLRVNGVLDTVRTLFTPPPRDADFRPLGGNFVLIEGEPGVALYAHLRDGSLRCRAGDAVRAGDELGRIGNSGDSAAPHLHFHLMSHADLRRAEGRLCAFAGLEEWLEGRWQPLASGVPDAMTPVRAVAA